MKKRVFIALPITDKLQDKIEEWKKNYRDLPVRWIKKENLHVTLIPPWYISKVDETIHRLKSVNQDDAIKPFSITFREVTFGPNPQRPRLIWASGDGVLEIIILKSKLEEILSPRQTWLAQKREKREFLIHLTIGRFKEKDFAKFPIKSLHDKVFWQEKVSSFLLMESHLKRSGAEYEKLAEIPLLS